MGLQEVDYIQHLEDLMDKLEQQAKANVRFMEKNRKRLTDSEINRLKDYIAEIEEDYNYCDRDYRNALFGHHSPYASHESGCYL